MPIIAPDDVDSESLLLRAVQAAQPGCAVTLELSNEQLAYLWRVVANDIDDATSLIRSRSFSQYGPVESEHIHSNVRIGATVLGQLPLPASQSTDQGVK